MTNERRKRPGWAFWTTVVLTATAVAYVVLYLYMVQPHVVPPPPGSFTRGPWQLLPTYRWGGSICHQQEFWEKMFAPVHWVDTKLRPDEWQVFIEYVDP